MRLAKNVIKNNIFKTIRLVPTRFLHTCSHEYYIIKWCECWFIDIISKNIPSVFILTVNYLKNKTVCLYNSLLLRSLQTILKNVSEGPDKCILITVSKLGCFAKQIRFEIRLEPYRPNFLSAHRTHLHGWVKIWRKRNVGYCLVWILVSLMQKCYLLSKYI